MRRRAEEDTKEVYSCHATSHTPKWEGKEQRVCCFPLFFFFCHIYYDLTHRGFEKNTKNSKYRQSALHLIVSNFTSSHII